MRSVGLKTQGQIIAPNVNRDWSPEDVFGTNFLVDFAQELSIITVEKYVPTCALSVDLTCLFRYPTDNCAAIFNTGVHYVRSSN
jgi:hypothetical protein